MVSTSVTLGGGGGGGGFISSGQVIGINSSSRSRSVRLPRLFGPKS